MFTSAHTVEPQLSEFYGFEGGALRDDNYVKVMTGTPQQGGGEERR